VSFEAMRRSRRVAPFIALAATLACGDGGGPPAPEPYPFTLLQPFDSGGLRVDTLAFHWPRPMVPVRIWVENAANLPTHVGDAITLWRDAFPGGAWNGTIVTDSNTADIIVRNLPANAPAMAAIRLPAQGLFCEGVTFIDTVATRFELRVPVQVRVYAVPAAPDPEACLGQVAAHELGHAIGLFRHSPFDDDLMYDVPTAQAPSDRDLATARAAYRTPADMVPVRP
jgi:predicted Zn-dependent protease